MSAGAHFDPNCQETMGLDEAYKAEIREVFQVFDEDRTGLISTNALKMLVRALGFRATRPVVVSAVANLDRGRKPARISTHDGDGSLDAATLDIEDVFEIVSRNFASRRDPNAEMKMNFRLFTDTDHITEDNLRRVARELGDDAAHVGDDQIRAMIETFDFDLDGKISLAEFRRIMAPPE